MPELDTQFAADIAADIDAIDEEARARRVPAAARERDDDQAEEVEDAPEPEQPAPEPDVPAEGPKHFHPCDVCEGSGLTPDGTLCDACKGSGRVL